MREPVRLLRLTPAELSVMHGLNAMFGAAFEDAATYGGSPPDDAYLLDLLAKPHLIALAALEGEAVVGGLVAYELDKFEQARREIYIYDLAVAEPHRRRRIATRLIHRLREIAAERRAYVIYVQADYGDEPAIALYASLGVREDVLHFDIPV